MHVAAIRELTIDIGMMPIIVRTDSTEFAHMLEDRYGEFVTAPALHAALELEIELVKVPRLGTRDMGHGVWDTDLGLRTPDAELRTPEDNEDDQDLSVRREAGRWVMARGDFRAEWDPQSRRGWVRQAASPYAIDGVLRILHSLILARQGGFLVHAASAVRCGRAYVFAGVSGAGKTTLARLAPPDVTLLTDEISYVRPEEQVPGARCQVSGAGSQMSGGSGEELEVRNGELGAKGQEESQIRNCKSQITNLNSTIDNRKLKISRFPNPEIPARTPWHLTPGTRHLAFPPSARPLRGNWRALGREYEHLWQRCFF